MGDIAAVCPVQELFTSQGATLVEVRPVPGPDEPVWTGLMSQRPFCSGTMEGDIHTACATHQHPDAADVSIQVRPSSTAQHRNNRYL
jgi:hypothetical protein